MRKSSRETPSRNWFSSSTTPFVGAAPALRPSQRGPGVFSALLNVDVFPDRLEPRRSLVKCGSAQSSGSWGAVGLGVAWAADGDYLLAYDPAGGDVLSSVLDGAAVSSVYVGAASRHQLARHGSDALLFKNSGNYVLSCASGAVKARMLGLGRYARFGVMTNSGSANPDYRLVRYGLECCITDGNGTVLHSGSINRVGTDCRIYATGGGAFTLSAPERYDTVRFWRTKQLNVTEGSLNNVAVGSPDEMYLLASVPLASLPSTVGGTAVFGPVIVQKTSLGYSFAESSTDESLDDTTVQTIDAINLSQFPACGSGCVAGGRFWGVDAAGGVVWSCADGTVWRELHDPLNRFALDGEAATAVCPFMGDVLVFTAGGAYRIPSANPDNGYSRIASYGVAGPQFMAALDGVGVFIVNQDGRARILTTSLAFVESFGSVNFSEQIGGVFSSGCRVAAHLGDVYVTTLASAVWKLNLASGCGWSQYSMGAYGLLGAVEYADGAKLAVVRLSDLAPFVFSSVRGAADTVASAGDTPIACAVTATLDAGLGIVELWDAELRLRELAGSATSVSLSCTVQDREWASGAGLDVQASCTDVYRLTAPRATAYKARPVGRYLDATVYYRGGVELLGLTLSGVVQTRVARPGWSPFAIFEGVP